MKNNNINEIIITDENEKEYWAEFQKIKKALINRYAPLVKYWAFKIKETIGNSFNSININFENYAKNKLGFEDEDFESLGFLGLSDAIDRYNPNNESDIKFETYASMRIQGAIFDAFRTIDGLPKSVRREIKKLNKTIEITIGIKMQNNLTKKEIDNLCKWAKKHNIEDLDTEEKILSIILDIKELKIVSDEIDYLPNEIFKLTNLESFYIDCYSLAEFPKDIEKLINLKKLTIESSDIKTLPKEIFNLVNLETLNIDCYSLAEFPDGISNLTKLKTLNFIYCEELIELKEFSKEIFNLKNLENIRLSYFNKFKGYYKKINDLDNIKNIELEIFDFDGFEFPKEILKLSKLRTLEMYGDNGYMKELPAEIENLINLKKLSIAVEILKCLPKEIGSLINLEYL